ncbi:hypothetical protein HPO96_12055 [Kribbella sandramycini]|uniref:Putative Zn finger protein n=1 Tax=Kribbella sandramycini TaxID=60450 RepID=A0A7Y4NZL4_9ACTN|nr:hypothetical protein [Kribbella sandramycini]MBB6569176.1 putative Zn finger protein [Kribbella sandramycini]NOL40983.1 hypothetical protein [Kribbella sandramycini]
MTPAQGYPAFGAQRRSTRGQSWWARAWVQALEDTSLDLGQLKKGRRYANSGQVGAISISPGQVRASVHAPEDTYEVAVRVDELSPEEWARFLEQVGARAGHIAALLDGEMPHELVEAASDAGVPLLPGIGDLDPSCTCDAWELPCQHAAGLAYQVAWLLDSDPFVLLLLRGQSRAELLDRLQAAASSGVDAVEETPSGVSWAELPAHPVGVMPEPPSVPRKVQLDDLAITTIEPPPGLQPAVLPLLVLDASRRARSLLIALLNGTPEPAPLDEWQDAVRLAADYPELAAPLAVATERPAELGRGVEAWRYGGAAGLDVLEHTWAPDEATLARARAALEDEEALTIADNHFTLGADVQLRLDRQSRWHLYRRTSAAGWGPVAPPTTDPQAALTADS